MIGGPDSGERDMAAAEGLRARIEERLSQLEKLLQAGDYEAAAALLPNITKFTSALNSADRDFLNAAKIALSENRPWS